MDKISVRCPAKINLSLDVTGKRDDGYHLLKMIMQSVELFDTVNVVKTREGINIYSNNKDIPSNEDNICFKAAEIMLKEFSVEGGLDIFIDKKIPVAAGLAGGSTDGAGVIFGINKLYNLNLSIDEMMKIGVRVGADVPYCFVSRTALAEGIGEILTPLKPTEAWCVIAKPNLSISTREVYTNLKIDEIPRHPDIEKIISYIEKGDIQNLAQNMVNVLETVTMKKYPIIFEIKNIMNEFHALGSLMSGSGPTVFGLFKDFEKAENCYNRLRDYLKEVYLVKTYNGGLI